MSETRNNLTTFDESLPCQIYKSLSEVLGDDRRLRTDGQTDVICPYAVKNAQ